MTLRYFASKLTLKIRIQDKNVNIRVNETVGFNNIVVLKLFFPRLRSYYFNWFEKFDRKAAILVTKVIF
jgi:hypothetical protein